MIELFNINLTQTCLNTFCLHSLEEPLNISPIILSIPCSSKRRVYECQFMSRSREPDIEMSAILQIPTSVFHLARVSNRLIFIYHVISME